jgi:CRISPR-associated protein Cmr1
MPSITFDLETVTPLFLSGADQTTAELRPPAFRGALRYWFRAIASTVVPFAEVQKWEKKVFGSNDNSGAVVIRVQSREVISTKSLKRDQETLGLSYLLFSTYGGGAKPPRGCFPPESSIKLVLQVRPMAQDGIDCLKLAAAAMWLLIYLGGIGSRSNRGGGNLLVKNISPKDLKDLSLGELEFKLQAKNINQMSQKINNGIEIIKSLYSSILKGENLALSGNPNFDILHENTAHLYLWQTENYDYWDFALDSIGSNYQQFRSRYGMKTNDDYPQVKEWIRSRGVSRVQTVKRAAFGLPIQFYFTSLQRPQNTASLEANQGINRSSSPLHIKVLKLEEDNYCILLIHFKTKLLPDGAFLVLKNKQARTQCAVPINQSIITEFLNTLSQNIVEVTIP